MAYTHWNELTPNAFGFRLQPCTAAEDAESAPFYPEDIILVTNQPNCASISKKMATFWGRRHQVWVGHDSSGNVIEGDGLIALRCPPYYPPATFAGMEETEASKPSGF